MPKMQRTVGVVKFNPKTLNYYFEAMPTKNDFLKMSAGKFQESPLFNICDDEYVGEFETAKQGVKKLWKGVIEMSIVF